MSIDLKIPKKTATESMKFKLPQPLVEKFQLYVQAAQDQVPDCDESIVLAEILKTHIAKDKSFKKWCQQRQSVFHAKHNEAQPV